MGTRQSHIVPGRPQTPRLLLIVAFAITAIHLQAQDSALVSHRAMNIFLANAIGYHLSTPNDLTLYKNSVTLNSDGNIAIYHNLRQSSGQDDPIRNFTSIGIQANIRYPETNQLGGLVKQTWLSKPRTRYTPGQKKTMDSVRAIVLPPTPPQNAIYTAPKDQSIYDDALFQAHALANTSAYQLITLNWTSASLYVPFLTQKDSTKQTFYPLHANLSHTRFWESSHWGRLYLTVAGDAQINKDFLTPSLGARFVYLPHTSHFGLSGALQQNFGPYHVTTAYIGLPIVLIDKKADPACTFEFQVRFNDPTTTVGVTAGIPFSKIAF
ncbi:MAG: hypothetical protein JST68_27065 [Bacteroidetes bacterium]|nr:hypothetical protein [Bacteroidota bacterium]